jgi:hypothetical protein
MRKLLSGFASATAFLIPQTILAADLAPASQAAPVPASTKVICRPTAQEGHLATTRCHTAAEWEALRRSNQVALQRIQLHAQQSQIHMGMWHGH